MLAAFGEIDISSVPVLRSAIDSLLGDGTAQLIVNLDEVHFMDSSGLNVLIGTARGLGPESLSVVARQPVIRRVFAISGVDQLVRVYDTVDEAASALPKAAPPPPS